MFFFSSLFFLFFFVVRLLIFVRASRFPKGLPISRDPLPLPLPPPRRARRSRPKTKQSKAIRQALESRLTLIQGPPGTGKTKTACNLILAAVKLRKSKGGARRDGKVRTGTGTAVSGDG